MGCVLQYFWLVIFWKFPHENQKQKLCYAVSTPRAINDDNPDPTWLAYRPEHTASVGTTCKPLSKLSINLNGRYISQYKSVSAHANTTRSNYPGGFIVTNAGLKYHVAEGAELSLLCRNIGNVQYEEAEWFRAPGRSFIAGVDFTF
ncbi:MAG: TonB-dependent receptor [Chlorobium sp.]|nr:TonB-dependent receptor [Chlorobium sp.]